MRETRDFSVGGREKKREKKKSRMGQGEGKKWGGEREKGSQRKEKKKKYWLVGGCSVWCVGEIKRREKNGVDDAPPQSHP